MKKLPFVPLLLLFLGLVTLSSAEAQNGRNDRSGDRVCVYENNLFQGWEECFRPGDEVNDLRGHRNNISSIRIFGNAVVTIYDDTNFRGSTMQITSDVRDLGQLGSAASVLGARLTWNDRVDSLRVSEPGRRPDPRDDRDSRNRRPDTENVICVYDERDYKGDYDCFAPDQDTSDLGRHGGWNDRISSIRVFGNARATAFLDITYRGERLVVDRDLPDLRQIRIQGNRTWDNQISSIEVSGGRSGNRR